ncbi:MAG: glycosyltransferase family 4 protein [Anaerolineae bacterium]|nr:glycosyltransferase family 4 protein [Anaerolineae bacterium]
MQKPLRILMLLENNPYLKDIRVRQEAQSLAKEGYAVTVICPHSKGRFSHDVHEGVRIYSYPPPPGGEGLIGYAVEYGYSLVMAFFYSLYCFLRRGFDVIHAHNPPDLYFIIARMYKLLGKTFVFDHHDLSPELYRYSRFGEEGSEKVFRALMGLEIATFKAADYVIATNVSYKQVALERGQRKPEQITIVRNGPDMAKLATAVQALEPVANPPGKTVIGFLGIIGFQDGADYLLHAVNELVHTHGRTDFLCRIVGDGAAVPSLKQQVDEQNTGDYVEFVGWVPHTTVPRYLQSFDICAAPEPKNIYTDQCTMIKMMEYMSVAKPIVAFDLTEHRRSAGEAAVYAQANDPADYAAKIITLLDDADLRAQLGQVGRQRVEDELAWEHQEKALLGLYAKITTTIDRAYSSKGTIMRFKK